MILVVVIAVNLIGVPDHLTGAMVNHLAVEVEVGNLCIISLSVKFVDALVILSSGVIIGSTRLLKEFLTSPYRHIFISSKIPLLVVMLVVFRKAQAVVFGLTLSFSINRHEFLLSSLPCHDLLLVSHL
ncbi:hypothetical protein PVK06_039073 [Gossypium arboreum]|uniref:Uncharacterized protein n=1 Tax=Gossypium arboreum TaxID=29729 RepID=A0ABR0N2I2_GOSAR|nr:hypothetical protein PVK06_039073 [Gossypium arboreum]